MSNLLTPGGTVETTQAFGLTTWPVTAATSGTDTACTNGTLYYASLRVPGACIVTGISYLIGSVGGTDKVIASIYDIGGNLIANSAIAGTTVGTAANLQAIPFTAPATLDAPNFFLLALTFNGTTAKFRSVPAFCGGGMLAGSATQTFGTVTSTIAVSATNFTADKGPVCFLYS